MRHVSIALALALTATLITGGAFDRPLLIAQQGGNDPPAEAAPAKRLRPAGEVDIHFANTSTVRMIVVTPVIEVQTPYGKLLVPVNDIRQIEFGVHLPDGVEKRIDDALVKLGSENFREREAGSAELIRIGADAYPAVHAASIAAQNDLEKSRRVKAVLTALRAKVPEKEQRLQHNDVIMLPTFTLVGRIVTPSIKAKAEYFGEVQLPVAQLRGLRSTDGPAEISVTVEAARYASNEWMPTDFEVDGRTKIHVTASGTVDLWPQGGGGGGYTCGPAGYNVGGPIFINGAGGRQRLHPGALMGKIGENGTPFLIGDNYEGTPKTEGKLYLNIGPSPWNNQSSGSFQVKAANKN